MSFRTTDKNDRVMIFLDLANITFGLSDHKGLEKCKIDHEDLAKTLIDGRKVVQAMAFDTIDYFKSKKSNADYLSNIGYKIVCGHLEDDMQKEVDVALATEMIMHAAKDHYDVAILISGDRDYIPAISAVQSLGKKVEVASFLNSTSGAIRNVSDKYVDIGQIPIVDCRALYDAYIFETESMEDEIVDNFVDVSILIESKINSREVE